jgi:membrane-bound lytic murein transglycosylase MltF
MWLAALFFVSATYLLALVETPVPTKTEETEPPTTTKQWTGDLDVLLKHGVIRVGVPYSKTLFYTVNGVEHGTAYETGKEFEKYLNRKYPQAPKDIKILVMFFVMSRDKAYASLQGGTIDILMGGVSVTPERQNPIDFSEPIVTGVREIAVTAPNTPPLSSLDDLSGKAVYVRRSSSYWEHLEVLNKRFQNEGRAPAKMHAVPEDLGDEDLLHMVNAGLLPAVIVNDWTAKLWSELLPRMQVHHEIAISTGGSFAWGVRKDSPKLLAEINDFLKTHREGTAFGQELLSRYTGGTYMLRDAVSESAMKRFNATAVEFERYSSRYNMDYLLMMAEGFQESELNQSARSRAGAIGVMQLMPSTGKEMHVGDITKRDPNIHAGIKYFHLMEEKYFESEPINELDKVLFTLAAYNCGADRVVQLRAEAAHKGLDPNVWMNNVEVIAAERIGLETVTYVSNIYKYYVAYKLIAAQKQQLSKDREAIAQQP